jgi:glycosyltransferase involved in cell wall biosynthesis
MLKISCIIPAFNEEKNIGSILSVVVPLIGTHIYEVIVVDDKSIDNTIQIVKRFPAVRLIEHVVNQGKSRTVSDAIKQSTGTYIFMLDADLVHLNEDNIISLIEPIESGKADLAISFRKNSWPLFPFKRLDYLSGERIFEKKYVELYLEEMASLPSYGLEVFLNKNVIIKNKLRISVVHWPNVENSFYNYKIGLIKGIKNIMKIWWNVICTVSVFEMYNQNIKMGKLMVE